MASLTRSPEPLPEDWLVDAWMPGLLQEYALKRREVKPNWRAQMAQEMVDQLKDDAPVRMERGALYDAYVWEGNEVPKFWR